MNHDSRNMTELRRQQPQQRNTNSGRRNAKNKRSNRVNANSSESTGGTPRKSINNNKQTSQRHTSNNSSDTSSHGTRVKATAPSENPSKRADCDKEFSDDNMTNKETSNDISAGISIEYERGTISPTYNSHLDINDPRSNNLFLWRCKALACGLTDAERPRVWAHLLLRYNTESKQNTDKHIKNHRNSKVKGTAAFCSDNGNYSANEDPHFPTDEELEQTRVMHQRYCCSHTRDTREVDDQSDHIRDEQGSTASTSASITPCVDDGMVDATDRYQFSDDDVGCSELPRIPSRFPIAEWQRLDWNIGSSSDIPPLSHVADTNEEKYVESGGKNQQHNRQNDHDSSSKRSANRDAGDAAMNDSKSETMNRGSVRSNSSADTSTRRRTGGFQIFPANCSAAVVQADVVRSLWQLYPADSELRDKRRRQLREVILRVTAEDPSVYYYQGLHEMITVCFQILCRVCRDRSSFKKCNTIADAEANNGSLDDDDAEVTDRTISGRHDPTLNVEQAVSLGYLLIKHRLFFFTTSDMGPTQRLLTGIHAIIQQESPRTAIILEKLGLAPASHYAVAGVVTWFTHYWTGDTEVDTAPATDSSTPNHCPPGLRNQWLRRIFDFLIASGPEMIIFVNAALVLAFQDVAQQCLPSAEQLEAGDIGMGSAYKVLSSLPSRIRSSTEAGRGDQSLLLSSQNTTINVEVLLKDALQLRRRHLQLAKDVASGAVEVTPLTDYILNNYAPAERRVSTAGNYAGSDDLSPDSLLWQDEDFLLQQLEHFNNDKTDQNIPDGQHSARVQNENSNYPRKKPGRNGMILWMLNSSLPQYAAMMMAQRVPFGRAMALAGATSVALSMFAALNYAPAARYSNMLW